MILIHIKKIIEPITLDLVRIFKSIIIRETITSYLYFQVRIVNHSGNCPWALKAKDLLPIVVLVFILVASLDLESERTEKQISACSWSTESH